MRLLLGLLVVLFNLMDNTTTFLCLRASVPGFEVIEANPVARWLFGAVGLTEGLLLEMFITTAAVCFLVVSSRIPNRVRLGVLILLAILPAWATLNNLHVMREIGLG
jgi:hypothetical protein